MPTVKAKSAVLHLGCPPRRREVTPNISLLNAYLRAVRMRMTKKVISTVVVIRKMTTGSKTIG